MTALGDEAGFILSNILSFLDLPLIYPLCSINSWWKLIISKGYFLQSSEFSIDNILHLPLLIIDEETIRTWDRVDPFATPEDSMRRIYCKRAFSKLEHLIACMKRLHGTLEKIETLEMYCLFPENENILIDLADLFPNVKLVRTFNSSIIELLQRNFVNLKQLFLSCQDAYTIEYLKRKPNLHFEEGLIFAKSLFSNLRTDEDCLELLKCQPFYLDIYYENGCNILDFAIIHRFMKSLKYILEKKASKVLNYNIFTNFTISKLRKTSDTEVLDILLTKIGEISQKSDEYFCETVQRSFQISSLLHPKALSNSLQSEIPLEKYDIDPRFLDYQAATMCDNSELRKHSIYSKYSLTTRLHEQCHPNYQSNITPYDGMETDAFLLNNDHQNIMHFICHILVYPFRTNTQYLKYDYIKEHVPEFQRLLFMENGMKLTPLNLLVQSYRQQVIDSELLQRICRDMFHYNKEEALKEFKLIPSHLCNSTLFYLISNSIEMPYKENITKFDYCTTPHIQVRRQLYYAFENQVVNLNPYDSGRTLLFKTSFNIEEFLMQCFVYFGGNVNHQDLDGNTALHITQSISRANLLLNIGADPNILNNEGEMAYAKFLARGSCKQKRNISVGLCKKCWKFFKSEKAYNAHSLSHQQLP